MYLNKTYLKLLILSQLVCLFLFSSVTIANESTEKKTVAFPDKSMIRLSGYLVDKATTNITILSNAGIGSGISFEDDLGSKDKDSIPRIDAYYRFNHKHRIDFTAFSIDRPGSKTLTADLTIGDETYNASETLTSNIKYTVYKLGYAYSFYHSEEVELSLLAGLSFTTYDINYSLVSGSQAGVNDVTAPLPTFGLSVGYKINPNWSVHYKSETFFIELSDKIKGALLNYELDIEYKLFKNFSIGAGVSRVSTDVRVKKDNWNGAIRDSHRGVLLYGTFYF